MSEENMTCPNCNSRVIEIGQDVPSDFVRLWHSEDTFCHVSVNHPSLFNYRRRRREELFGELDITRSQR